MYDELGRFDVMYEFLGQGQGLLYSEELLNLVKSIIPILTHNNIDAEAEVISSFFRVNKGIRTIATFHKILDWIFNDENKTPATLLRILG